LKICQVPLVEGDLSTIGRCDNLLTLSVTRLFSLATFPCKSLDLNRYNLINNLWNYPTLGASSHQNRIKLTLSLLLTYSSHPTTNCWIHYPSAPKFQMSASMLPKQVTLDRPSDLLSVNGQGPPWIMKCSIRLSRYPAGRQQLTMLRS
jgi:hypothetical protein